MNKSIFPGIGTQKAGKRIDMADRKIPSGKLKKDRVPRQEVSFLVLRELVV
jgi:hypothetical protein